MNKSVIGTKQMVVSPHYLASQAGNRILDKEATRLTPLLR